MTEARRSPTATSRTRARIRPLVTRFLLPALAVALAGLAGCADDARPDGEPAGEPSADTAPAAAPDTGLAAAPEPDSTPGDEPAVGPDTATGQPAPATEPSPEPMPEPSPSPEPEMPRSFEGRVVVTSGVPGRVVTLAREGGPLVLTGDLTRELRRLSGARVRVAGVPDASGPGDAIRVSSYEIVAIDGRTPHVGALVPHEDGVAIRTVDGVLLLRGAPADLLERLGAEVWIVGEVTGSELRVQSYGVIRPADAGPG